MAVLLLLFLIFSSVFNLSKSSGGSSTKGTRIEVLRGCGVDRGVPLPTGDGSREGATPENFIYFFSFQNSAFLFIFVYYF